jgi:uncharacterized protein YodC (DUF2158 family)
MRMDETEIKLLYQKFASPLDSYATSPVRKQYVEHLVQLLWRAMIFGHDAKWDAWKFMRGVGQMEDSVIEAMLELYHEQMCPLVSEHELAALREHYHVASEAKLPTLFNVGDKVRVKQGGTDIDHPDMPLGGSAGTIARVYSSGLYLVRWSPETLENANPVYRTRSKREGKKLEEYRFWEHDLEPDLGGPLVIEQPMNTARHP